MTPEPSALRLVTCPDCETNRQTIDGMNTERDHLIATITNLTQQLGRARTARRQQGTVDRADTLTKLRTDPNWSTAEALFVFWVKVSGRTRRTTFGEERAKPLLARLEDYVPREVAIGIRGFCEDERVRAGRCNTDLEYLVRSGATLERFRDQYLRHHPNVSLEREQTP